MAALRSCERIAAQGSTKFRDALFYTYVNVLRRKLLRDYECMIDLEKISTQSMLSTMYKLISKMSFSVVKR